MTDIRASLGHVIGLSGGADLRASLGHVFVAANYPAEFIRGSMVVVSYLPERQLEMRVSQARVFVLGRGRVAPNFLRAWTFTLDSHDFYVLQLPQETLVCDLSTGRWHVWGSGDDGLWRGWLGRQWVATTQMALSYGSNVVVADDTFSTLYFLSPEVAVDDSGNFEVEDARPFKRVVTGQVTLRGRSWTPCNGVSVMGSVGQLYDATFNTVELETSDDLGATYVNHGSYPVVEGDYAARLEWLSLGSMSNPGRLFRVVDYGALTRIDDLSTVDEDAES
jgi:hypothetical protein